MVRFLTAAVVTCAAGAVSGAGYLFSVAVVPSFMGLVLLLLATAGKGWRARLFLGFLWGSFFFGITQEWITAFNRPGYFCTVAYCSLYPAAACWLQNNPLRPSSHARVWAMSWCGLAWAGVFYARGFLMSGFPSPGGLLSEIGAGAWLAPVIGQTGADLVAVSACCWMADTMARRQSKRMVGLAGLFVGGGIFLPCPAVPASHQSVRILAVQAAKGRSLAYPVLKHLETAPAIVVWPECSTEAIGPGMARSPEVDYMLGKGAMAVIYGVVSVAPIGGSEKIAMYAASSRTLAHHVKTKLIPFGEFNPLPSLPGIHRWINGERSFEAVRGTEHRSLSCAGLKVIPLICYEDYFSSCIVECLRADRADLIICAGNATDFAGTNEGRIHLISAKWRAMEAGLWMVRCYTGGITCLVSPSGATQVLPQDSSEMLDVLVPLRADPGTLYVRWGHHLGSIALLLTLCLPIGRILFTEKLRTRAG